MLGLNTSTNDIHPWNEVCEMSEAAALTPTADAQPETTPRVLLPPRVCLMVMMPDQHHAQDSAIPRS